MSDIVDILDSTTNNDSLNLNVDDDSDESSETPFQRLVRLHSSHSNYNKRKNAVKYILDALRFVNELESLYEILSCTKKLADDIVTQVQIDTLEKFVSIIEYLIGNVENADILIKEYLFQSIIQTIGHSNNRIRKASQSALIRLFEMEQIKSDEIEQDIIPSLCQLERASDDFKNESIILMTRLTQYVSSELILKYFVPTIVQQSSSIAFQTRKTCATSIGDIATVIPSTAVDQYLVPCISNLCSDPFWGVRKSCAEVIHPVAQVCSKESRWNILSPCLIQLLQDQSRWVKTAALRVLGYFISTFAKSNQEESIEEDKKLNLTKINNEQIDALSSQIEQTVKINSNDQFNDFNYWREPLLTNIDFDQDFIENSNQFATRRKQSLLEISKHFDRDDINSILPIELLDFYTNLIEQSHSSGVETDIVHQGAHTFPAVAFTLTNKNWHLIRDLHRKFAEDLQWKVRRTLAYSLHALAEILTAEQVEEDLCPIFDSFYRDVDEVKIGILSNLARFLKVLQLSARRNYLDKLTYLTCVDNQRNWRFRYESANQLYELTSLFSSVDVADYISPLAFGMAVDKVADVRQAAIKALSGCYLKFTSENGQIQMEVFLDDCHRVFASSQDWKLRQVYVNLCESIYKLHVDTPDQYALRFLGRLLSLKEDQVVNVRLSLGTFIYENLVNNEFYIGLSDDWRSQIDECLQILLVDHDRDVRASVGGVYQARVTSLSSENLNDDSDSSIQNNTITLGDEQLNQS
ncbi:unnamed protein product [Rotaria socialis]|uniref:Phosphatase 2A Regulatory Subunit A helical domain-containing protein n=1 Tax=Rotaria socialis TaxID=392032 RepID=A0A821HNT5_9BILA|nr:unnamed protein product [Rotaria socialis]CAF3366073.1 unnamed protein product [Rotaria socialis]CAF3465385.1 unnamed protein product [Rotaria socialis]CAF4337443.1 unnamed protein product [Rotaria socialis]CAF4437585.1 unnamed protein product [Rotaria socialis]